MTVSISPSGSLPDPAPALGEFDNLTAWYAKNASLSRRRHYVLEVALLIVGASVPVAALALPGNGVPAAILGGVVVVFTGLRQVFHWHDNYVRFIEAWQALKHERRKYNVFEPPYDDPTTRDRMLIDVMNSIERQETRGWTRLMDTTDKSRSAEAQRAN
jgi:Protein of unknown function (DUF4231)